METIDAAGAVAVLERLKNLMTENRDFLVELDGRMGDGDLGLTMAKAFSAAWEECKGSPETEPGKIFMKAGMAMAKAAPSTMGTLAATGFMRGGKAVAGKPELSVGDLSVFFEAFVQGIMDRGKAQPGDKTIVDSLHPAAEAFKASAGKNMAGALAAALAAAEAGLEATKAMIAKHGRIAYYGDKSIGMQDPGATVGVFILRGFLPS